MPPMARTVNTAILCRSKTTSTKLKVRDSTPLRNCTSVTEIHQSKSANVKVKTANMVETVKTVRSVKAVKTAKRDYIDRFFSSYPAFDYRPTAQFLGEFQRLTARRMG